MLGQEPSKSWVGSGFAVNIKCQHGQLLKTENCCWEKEAERYKTCTHLTRHSPILFHASPPLVLAAMAFRVLLLVAALLVCVNIAEVSSSVAMEGRFTHFNNQVIVRGGHRRLIQLLDCDGLCKVRCSQHSRPNVCTRACGTCCRRCSCVPPGTSGNKEMCGSCYTDMKTHGNKPKCP